LHITHNFDLNRPTDVQNRNELIRYFENIYGTYKFEILILGLEEHWAMISYNRMNENIRINSKLNKKFWEELNGGYLPNCFNPHGKNNYCKSITVRFNYPSICLTSICIHPPR
jgi:hypothetical protein